MKIVVVDDSPDALALAKARLAKEYVDILCADGGKTGLEMIRRETPDLILLDVDMPDVSGFDVCRILKNDAELFAIPVIFLSGSGDAQDKVRGLDLGAVDYVTKPFDAFELRARVRAALRTKRLQDLLTMHAHLDPLTELSNRRAMTKRLGQEWERIQRHGGTLSFALADVDHFKQVNDTFGHSVGDRVLRRVARALVTQCRQIDLPVRYGGEEFAVIVPDETAEKTRHLLERCRECIADTHLNVGDAEVRVTVSFGAADSSDRPSLEAMVEAADHALYQAKQTGRNRVEIATHGEPARA
jgi:diguanylate cyclase (GGDEF)-like protein